MSLAEVFSFGRPKTKPADGAIAPIVPVEYVNPHQQLEQLGPESKIKGTSYSAGQNEVREMIDATKKFRWPGFWYELLQGAYEYNDWRRGQPRILVYYRGVDQPVSLTQFVVDRRHLLSRKVEKVEIRNYIRGDTGLRPHNVAATLHEEKDEQVGLSAHGRGMKISSTCGVGYLAKGITYKSWTPGIGAWFGKGEIARDEEDPRPSDTFQLRYNNNPKLNADETIFTVLEPNGAALKALTDLPKWFLPTNPAYEHYRLDAEAAQTQPNKVTIFANHMMAGVDEHTLAFTGYDLHRFGADHLRNEKNTVEMARVEILPDTLVGKRRGKVDYVYVDGLRVQVEGAQFANVYSFWGWGNCDYGFNPRRSNDSLKLSNSMDYLLGTTLCRCTNPNVFLAIFRANYGEKSTFEGRESLLGSTIADLERNLTPESRSAITSAWNQFLTESGIQGEVFVTADRDAKKRAKREKKPTVLLQNNCMWLVVVATQTVKRVEDVFETEARLARQRQAELENEKQRLQQQLEAKKQEKEREKAYLLAEAKKQMEDDARRLNGIREVAEQTNEFIRVAVPEDQKLAKEMAQLSLINLFVLNNGSFQLETGAWGKPGKLTIDLEIPELMRVPQNVQDMGQVGEFVLRYLAASSAQATTEVRFVLNGDGVYFNLGRAISSKQRDKFGNYSLFVSQGTLDMPDKHLVRITLEASTDEEQKFHAETVKLLRSFQSSDGTPNVDAYLESEQYQNYPPAEGRLLEKRRAQVERREYEAQLARQNKERRRIGLPPIANIYESQSTKKKSEFADEEEGIEEVTRTRRDRKTLAAIRRSEERVIGDVDIQESVLSLLHPDSRLGISRHGEKSRRRMVHESLLPAERLKKEANARAREIFKRQLIPDCTMSSGEFSKVRPYLIDHFEIDGFSTADYDLLGGFEYGQLNNLPKLRFNKSVGAGLGSLPCPPGYRPVGYYHPGGEIKGLQFTGNLDRNVYAISLPRAIDKGLIVYYRRLKSYQDTTEPTAQDRENQLNLDTLTPQWRELLVTLKNSPLNDKQKADIIIRAWSRRGFRYDKSEATFRLYDSYGDFRSPEFCSAILNFGIGDCGYAERGWQGAGTASGLAVQSVPSYLAGVNGSFSMRENLHGLVRVFIRDRWVLVEPQVGYLEPGYELEEIPAAYRELFTRLIEAIPEGMITSPDQLAELPSELSDETENYSDLMQELRTSLAEYFGGGSKLRLSDIVGAVSSGVDMYGKRRLALAAAKAGGYTLVGKLALEQIGPYLPKAAAAVIQYLETLPPELMEKIGWGALLLMVPMYHAIFVGAGYQLGKMAQNRKNHLRLNRPSATSKQEYDDELQPAILPAAD